MSADDGVYILRTLSGSGSGNSFEYRVAVVSAIDNFDYFLRYRYDSATGEKDLADYIRQTWPGPSLTGDYDKSCGLAVGKHINNCTEYGVSMLVLNDVHPNDRVKPC